MLFARCASRGIRRIAPDAISGLYATEEMQDAAPLTPTGPPIPVVEAEVVTPQGPPPAENVGQAAPPPPPASPKKTFWAGMVTLETVNGPKLCKCTDAHKEFSRLGEALGKDTYRAVLEGVCPDYHKFDDIPRDMVAEVYETLRLKLDGSNEPSFDPDEFALDGEREGGK
jgi:hypothetical protein